MDSNTDWKWLVAVLVAIVASLMVATAIPQSSAFAAGAPYTSSMEMNRIEPPNFQF